MNKLNFFNVTATGILTAISIKLGSLAMPLMVLIAVMAMDYLTGIVAAYKNSVLNSRIGALGIIKKVGYLVLVAAAGIVDYLFTVFSSQLSIDFKMPFLFALLVTVWLIINELISILENLVKWGVPIPIFLTKIIDKLKVTIDAKGDAKNV